MKKKYFALTAPTGNPIPQIVNWYGKLDVRKVNRQDYKYISEHLFLDMRTGMDVVYPDILTTPVLMVSEKAMEVIKIYVEEMPFLHIILFDEVREESIAYYCPILEEVEEEEMGREALYRVKHPDGYEIMLCEELIESLLDRGATGMELKQEY